MHDTFVCVRCPEGVQHGRVAGQGEWVLEWVMIVPSETSKRCGRALARPE